MYFTEKRTGVSMVLGALLLLMVLPFVSAVAVAPSTGAQLCETFVSCIDYDNCDQSAGNHYENSTFTTFGGFWDNANMGLATFEADGNGGFSVGAHPTLGGSTASALISQIGDSPRADILRTIAWRWLVNDSEPPSECGTSPGYSVNVTSIRAFGLVSQNGVFDNGADTWVFSDELRMAIDENYRMQSFLIDGNTIYWNITTSPVSPGWHTFVLKMGQGGAKLYIDGVLSGTATGTQTDRTLPETPLGGSYFMTFSGAQPLGGSSGNYDYTEKVSADNRCSYSTDNIVLDAQQWDAQRISEYTESNIASQGFTCTPSALTGDVTNPTMNLTNYSVSAGLQNFTFSVSDNAELNSAYINCAEFSANYTLFGLSRTLGAYFDATISQTCSVAVDDTSANGVTGNFTIEIQQQQESGEPLTLTGNPTGFASEISRFAGEVLIVFAVFGILVYPLWKGAK